MIKKFPILFAAAAIAFLSSSAFAQRAEFRGLTAGALVKAGTGGIADEATTGTATSTAAAATLNTDSGKITTEALTTAGLANYTFTLTNSKIAATSKVFVSVENGTNTQGTTVVHRVTPGAGSCVIIIRNQHATEALNGTLKFSFLTIQ